MEARGRGKARGGRARGEPSHQTTTRPGQGPGPQQRGPPGAQGGVGVPPPQGAWGRPQGPPAQRPPQQPPQQQQAAPQPPQGAWGRPQAGPPQQQAQQPQQGRGSRVGGGDEAASRPYDSASAGVSGSGGPPGLQEPRAERGGGNGGVRGRLNRNEVIHTKPATLTSKQGSSGQVIKLTANFFKIINKPDWCLHQYRVDFNPNVDDTRTRRFLVNTAFKRENDIGGFLFDGTVMYTPNRLNPEPMERTAASETTGPVTMSARHVGELSWGDHHYIQVFNIIVRMCLRMMNLQLVGREYFDPGAEINLPEHKLKLWPGYYTSIRQHETDILMNAEVKSKIMRSDNVYDLLLECRDRGGAPDFSGFCKKIIGSVVLTFYNNKTYRVDDVDTNVTPQSQFKMKSGASISYIEYYKQKYAINIQVPTQPMLVSRSNAREIRAGMPDTLYLVPELCQMTGLSDEQRANFHLMSALATHTRISPGDRQQRLTGFIRKLTSDRAIMDQVRRWDLAFADRLIEFNGRVLGQERMGVGSNVSFPSGPKADWTMNLRSNAMLYAPKMEKMAVITPQNLAQATDEFMKCVCKAAAGMKWSLNNYRLFTIQNDRSGSYLDKLEEVFSTSDLTLVMCVLPTKTADRYNAIKKKCCVDKGIPSQVVVARNFKSKGVMSIATKLCIQLNCKIGGAPWTVTIPLKGLMVVGYDVCRDTANRGKSFGGLVASLDESSARYLSAVSEHTHEAELSNNFGAFMVLACQKYKNINNSYPAKILIYRDGVGDGQIPYVLDQELKSIKNKLLEIYQTEANIKLAFVIVSKRINTRVFSGSNNPPPGTVVDNTVTLPERYDFFIVSQCVNQGTVAPTSYNVIHDTMGLPPDRMQVLTYKLCHMYFNWSGTVRVPAPCQYAHKLAYLTAQSLHRGASRKLENVLYFL